MSRMWYFNFFFNKIHSLCIMMKHLNCYVYIIFFYDSLSASSVVYNDIQYTSQFKVDIFNCYNGWLWFIITTCNLITVTFSKNNYQMHLSAHESFAWSFFLNFTYSLNCLLKFKCRSHGSHTQIYNTGYWDAEGQHHLHEIDIFFKVFMITTKCCQ